jgi:hypothetical protein
MFPDLGTVIFTHGSKIRPTDTHYMKIKLPALRIIVQDALSVARRFPFVILITFVGTILAFGLVELSAYDEGEKEIREVVGKLLIVCSVGLALLYSLTVWGEAHAWDAFRRLGVNILGLLLLVLYYLLLEFGPQGEQVIYQYLLLLLVVHLMAAVLPFLWRGTVQGFWHYNSVLFTRILMALSYTGVLGVGISIAMAAIQNLLDINIDSKRYAELFIVLLGIFNTLFFLRGIPNDWQSLDSEDADSPELYRLTSYVLLPLNVIYLVILYLYMGKIAIEGSLPKGYVTYLVQGFSIVGILALLLVYPQRDKAEHRWIRLFWRWFFIALLPLVALQFLAIGVRVGKYGLTVERYFVIQLAVWLLVVALYNLLSKTKDIRFIPASLIAFVFFSSTGPWGAFSASERSQLRQVEQLASANGLMKDGKLVPVGNRQVPDSVVSELGSKLKYLIRTHDKSTVQPLLTESLFTYKTEDDVIDLLNTKYGISYTRGVTSKSFTQMTLVSANGIAKDQGLPLFGAQYALEVQLERPYQSDVMETQRAKVAQRTIEIVPVPDSLAMRVNLDNRPSMVISFASLRDTLGAMGSAYATNYKTISPGLMTFEQKASSVRVRFLAKNLVFEKDKNRLRLTSVTGLLLLSDQ